MGQAERCGDEYLASFAYSDSRTGRNEAKLVPIIQDTLCPRHETKWN